MELDHARDTFYNHHHKRRVVEMWINKNKITGLHYDHIARFQDEPSSYYFLQNGKIITGPFDTFEAAYAVMVLTS